MNTIDELAATVREQLGAREKRIRDGRYGDTHWDMLLTRAILGGWVESRQAGVDSKLNDRIVKAGVEHMRQTFDRWQQDDAVGQLADVERERTTLDRLLAEKHHVADDQYYTCPAATRERDGGTYAETDGGGQCTCRRDERVAGYLGLMAQAWREET